LSEDANYLLLDFGESFIHGPIISRGFRSALIRPSDLPDVRRHSQTGWGADYE
jgi:hypothetical protein